MPNYGFRDKQVAIKLRDSVTALTGLKSSNGMSGGAEDDFVNFKNLTGATIPAFGLVFASGDSSVDGIPAVGAVTFAVASDEAKRHPIFNGADPVADDDYGSGKNTNAYFTALSDTSATVTAGDRYYASATDDYKVTKTKDGSSPIWSAVIGLDPNDVGSAVSSDPLLVRAIVKGGVFPVDLTQTGGAQGTQTTKPTWTYSVFDASERGTGPTALETVVDPAASPHNWVRHLGHMTAATFGLAFYNVDGDLELTWINEQTITAECVE